MKKITLILTEIVSQAFVDCGFDADLGSVTASDRPDICQFQCNGAFKGAKLYKKAPLVIASAVAENLAGLGVFSKCEAVAPGFINMTLCDDFLLKYVLEIANDENLGVEQVEVPETIVLDYGGPNVAKPLHVGHLRSAIIGEAVKRIARATGRKVIGDVHLGDWGLQMGLVIAEYKVRHPEWACFKPDFNPETDALPEIDVAELNEVYPFASAKSKQDEAFAKEAHEVTKQLQDHHVGYYSLWKQFMKVSIEDIKKSYQKLSVDFDLWYGESDADAYVNELLEVLTQKGLLRESEGAMVVDVEEETDKAPIPPVIIKKSDNSNIYATTDLATMIQREKDFAPEKMWYITDKRQALHFSQIFRCAKKAEILPSTTELRHLGFGTMCGADGKPFKTRDGGVMRLSDLINTVTESAFEKLKDSEYVTGDKSDIAEKIGVAALKFGDLLNQPSKDYVFDIAKFLSFDGKTGVYLLYTITRINSILKKAGVDYDASLELGGVYTDQERDLMLTIALSGEVYGKAFEEMAPCYLCDNAYSLATAFSRFYHDNHILNEQDAKKRESWLALCLLTRRILVNHLDMLAIEYVENM